MDLAGLSVAKIKKLVCDSGGVSEELLLAMASDSRAGVREIHRRLKKQESALEAEKKRLAKMFLYEEDLWSRGYAPVAGVDEAGRGPLAGPVVAAAVILREKMSLFDLNDSKKLTAAKREALAGQIKKVALAWAIGVSTVEEIYRDNIHHAGLMAMRRAVLGLTKIPAYVLVDGFKIGGLDLPQMPLVGGDGISASIAAASILAKVTRDHLMDTYHHCYPEYGFDRHKGYATPEHLNALARFGHCPIHRVGFQPVKGMLEGKGRG